MNVPTRTDRTSKGLVGEILELYGIENAYIAKAQSGYRNHSYKVTTDRGELYNVIIFKAEDGMFERIERMDQVSQRLHDTGLPVRYRIDKRVIQMQTTGTNIRYAALYNYLPGETISWDAYTKNHLKALGLAMARMHKMLTLDKSLMQSLQSEISIYKESAQLIKRIQTYFERIDVQKAAAVKLGLMVKPDYQRLVRVITAATRLNRQQVLHMDFVRGNILFTQTPDSNAISYNNVHISGLIDFEKTSFGSPLFDLARTLAFLYVDCRYKPGHKIKKYFLYSGYKKHGHMFVDSSRILDELVQFYLLHDLYKFLLHNPYESLQQNQHYLRTRDILLSKNMLEYIHTD